jgi:hypothetical protein
VVLFHFQPDGLEGELQSVLEILKRKLSKIMKENQRAFYKLQLCVYKNYVVATYVLINGGYKMTH